MKIAEEIGKKNTHPKKRRERRKDRKRKGKKRGKYDTVKKKKRKKTDQIENKDDMCIGTKIPDAIGVRIAKTGIMSHKDFKIRSETQQKDTKKKKKNTTDMGNKM